MRLRVVGCVLVIFSLNGFAAPLIAPEAFPKPLSIVIDDIPDIRTRAVIGLGYPRSPFGFFDKWFDDYYDLGQEALPGWQVGGTNPYHQNVVGAIMESGAANTERKAVEFPSLVKKTMPAANFTADFMRALREGLEAKGIAVRIAPESRKLLVRPRWAGIVDVRGRAVTPGELADSPPVNADLLVQVSPLASYGAAGPMNPYKLSVGVAVAVFDGRTKAFLGWQMVAYDGPQRSYMTYDALVEDLPQAGPALYGALMSVVPKVVKLISAENQQAQIVE